MKKFLIAFIGIIMFFACTKEETISQYYGASVAYVNNQYVFTKTTQDTPQLVLDTLTANFAKKLPKSYEISVFAIHMYKNNSVGKRLLEYERDIDYLEEIGIPLVK